MKIKISHLLTMAGGLLFAAGAFLLMPGQARATAGLCANCHVMHASQTGTASTPRDYLLNSDCLGCHTGTNDGTNGPYVLTTGLSAGTDISTDLAGGNFGWAEADARLGHNPSELTTADTLTQPPGWKSTGFDANGQVGTSWAADKLTCAGTYGCHGTHDANGVTGAHHSNASGAINSAPTSVGGSYRFLYGIEGYEDDDYEYETTTDHNVYYGEARTGLETSGDRVSDTHTMSYFCAECHGIFHSGSGSEGMLDDSTDTIFTDPWVRHPVDISMPTSGEYAGYSSYDPDVPVASSDVSDGSLTVSNAADRIVMCLSCHRAHASPWNAALRWDPSSVVAGGGSSTTGCFACHTTKDT